MWAICRFLRVIPVADYRKGGNMTDAQVKKILDRTFSEVDLLVREVQQKRKFEKNVFKCGNAQQKKKSLKKAE